MKCVRHAWKHENFVNNFNNTHDYQYLSQAIATSFEFFKKKWWRFLKKCWFLLWIFCFSVFVVKYTFFGRDWIWNSLIRQLYLKMEVLFLTKIKSRFMSKNLFTWDLCPNFKLSHLNYIWKCKSLSGSLKNKHISAAKYRIRCISFVQQNDCF